MKNKSKIYDGYQVGDDENGQSVEIADLTEEGAKIELKKAIDVIERMTKAIHGLSTNIEEWRHSKTSKRHIRG